MIFLFRREDDLDVEVSASGFTRQMEKDLYVEMGIEEDDNGSEKVEKELDRKNESSDVEELRKKVEDLLNEVDCEVQNNSEELVSNNSESDTAQLPPATTAAQSDSVKCDKLQDEETEGFHILKVDRNPLCSSGDEKCEEERPSERIRLYSSTYSMCSTSTVATIAPEEIRGRVKKSLERRQKSSLKKRITVKGEASAVTRSRRENLDTIKQCDGIWTWE
jgi:RIO kinase 2